jgi:hypothetical protein
MQKRKGIVSLVAAALLLAALLLLTGLISTPSVVAASPTQWTVPSNPFGVAIGDYDNDGSNDIAFTIIGSVFELFVYKSDGVTLLKHWTSLASLRGVDIGDYDNDGSNDLAFAQTQSLGGGTVTVYKNDSVTMIKQWTGLYSPLFISIGDYDNDGLNDLAFTEMVAGRVTVYKSDGTTIIKQWTGLNSPYGVAIGDYDNDGLNDLAFTEAAAGTVTVYKSDGTTIIKQWTGLNSPRCVAIGDYDNDGLNDLAFVESTVDRVTVYKSDGITVIKQLTGLGELSGVAIGDYNNDGLFDLALCEYDAWRVTVHYAIEQSVTILSHSGYLGSGGEYWIYGEVQNLDTAPVGHPTIEATFYDSSNTIIAVETCHDLLNVIPPNHKSPFDGFLYNGTQVDHYTLEITSASYTEALPVGLNISSSSVDRWLDITGLVENTGTTNSTSTRIYVTYYDSDGKVVYTNWGYIIHIEPYVISPGQNASFWIPSDPARVPLTKSYALTAESQEYSCLEFSALPVPSAPTPTSISCFVASARIQLGENIMITGSLSPTIENVSVALTFIKPDNSTITQNVTLIQGEYAYAFKPDSSGSWHVKASWPGNIDYEGANSTLVAFEVEFLTTVRQIVPPENAAVAIAVGTGVTVGITALMSLGGFAQSFNGAVSRLPVPKWLKDFLNLYGEKTFETLTQEELLAAKRKKIITLREILSLLIAGAALLGVFVYVEVNGMPNLLNIQYLLAAVPQVLISVLLVFALSQMFSIISAKALGICCEFKMWLYGLVALLITGIVFMIPFASPGKVEYQGDVDPKRAGLTATSKILCILILCIPFYLFYVVGFDTIADAGLMMAMMTACYSAFPVKPLEGKEIFRYNKGLWIVTFISSFSMFVFTIFSLLPHLAYLLAGTVATLLFVGLILTLKRRQSR